MKKVTDSLRLIQSIRLVNRNKLLMKKNKKRRSKKRNAKKSLHSRYSRIHYKLECLKAYKRINNRVAPVSKKRWKYNIKIPKIFCLYEEPEQVLAIIKKIASLEDAEHINEIFIDHSQCVKHDLSAEILLANVVKSLNLVKGPHFRIKGAFPRCKKMKRLLSSIGVVSDTAASKYCLKNEKNLKLYKRLSDPFEEDAATASFFCQDKKNAATSGFTDYLKSCLKLISASLDSDEESKLNKYLGEVLGNAEDHSGLKLWQLVGYLDSSDRDNLYCEIVIFNIGKTFLDTFLDKENAPIVNDKRVEYVNKHKGILSEEQLTLVYALQQNASSKLDEEVDRGQGTKYLIDLFHHFTDKSNEICASKDYSENCKPKMFILSGNAILKMDGTYNPLINEKEKMVYALNKSNDLLMAPDKKYINALRNEECFPGTVIYIRYSLQETKLIGNEDGT